MEKVRNAAALAVGLLCGSLLACDGTASNRTFVQLRPEQNSFWHTATNATLTLPVTYPHGATKAALAVRGVGYSRDYADITGDEFTLNLPPAAGPADENVYRLTLTFDNGVEQTATLGLVCGYAAGPRAATRCLLEGRVGEWNQVVRRGVLPIPFGTTSLTVNGEPVDPGLDGDQGWYALGKVRGGETYDVSLTVGGVDYAASLLGNSVGTLLILR